ncbi:MAG TPA: SpoIIE family protein phosphatase [Thermoanaerobaculia bacterium]|nr:SpoIIE family protein phosphatase [Thermoanaerobaculia bacterium]
MPAGKDWVALVRSTFRAVGRKDLSGLYRRDWRRALEKLTTDSRDEIDRTRGRIRRWLRTSNAVLFGLAGRLSPPRRVLLAVALLALLFSLQGPARFKRTEEIRQGVRRTSSTEIFFDNGWLFVALLAVGSLLAMELVDKINYRDELELARDLQASLIPKQLPEIPGWEIGASNRIANTVGGDIYDFVPIAGGRMAVLFGDASGHGMAAGLVMAVAHAAFRTQLEVDPSPAAMFATLNRILCRTGSPRAFFGGVYLVLSSDGSWSGCVAGHPQILRLSPSGDVLERIGRGAYPLGIRVGLDWPVESGLLAPGERLLLYSDGVPEARNAAGQEFGDDRIEDKVRRVGRVGAATLVTVLASALSSFLGEQEPEDDISIAVLVRSAPPAPA